MQLAGSASCTNSTHHALQDPMEDEDGPILLDEFGQPVVQVRQLIRHALAARLPS